MRLAPSAYLPGLIALSLSTTSCRLIVPVIWAVRTPDDGKLPTIMYGNPTIYSTSCASCKTTPNQIRSLVQSETARSCTLCWRTRFAPLHHALGRKCLSIQLHLGARPGHEFAYPAIEEEVKNREESHWAYRRIALNLSCATPSLTFGTISNRHPRSPSASNQPQSMHK